MQSANDLIEQSLQPSNESLYHCSDLSGIHMLLNFKNIEITQCKESDNNEYDGSDKSFIHKIIILQARQIFHRIQIGCGIGDGDGNIFTINAG
jgi:hypothetical protein